MATPAIQINFSAARARSYIFRLPLFTRLLLLIIVAVWIATVVLGDSFDVKAWGALVPDEVGITSCMSFRTLFFLILTRTFISTLGGVVNFIPSRPCLAEEHVLTKIPVAREQYTEPTRSH